MTCASLLQCLFIHSNSDLFDPAAKSPDRAKSALGSGRAIVPVACRAWPNPWRLGAWMLFGAMASPLHAQTGSFPSAATNLGTITLNKPATATLTFTFGKGGSIKAPVVLDQGLENLEFADTGTGTCTSLGLGWIFSDNATCTVVVSFTPKLVGERYGAVEIFSDPGPDFLGSLLATAYLQGTGAGPLVVFAKSISGENAPGQKTVLATGSGGPNGIAMDAAGDVFVTNLDSSAVEEFVAVNGSIPASPTKRSLGSGFNWPYGVAVDGSGNVFVGDRNNDAVKEIVAAGGYTTVKTLGGGFAFGGPNGVAVDANDNVFVADWVSNAVYEIVAAGGYTTVKTLGGGWNYPDGVAVDGNGNVFVADFYDGVREMMAADDYATTKTLVSGMVGTSSVAVDASGNLFVTNWFAGSASEILAAGGYTIVKTLASGFWYPNDLTLDGKGNVIVADQMNRRLVTLDYTDPPSLTFAAAKFGQTSSDSPQTVTLGNVGNAPLNFSVPTTGENPSVSTDFSLDPTTTCPELTISSSPGTLASGATCDLAVNFVPATNGNISGSIVLTDNDLDAANASQSIALSGIGNMSIATLTAPASGSTLSATAATTFTWTAGTGPTGYELWLGTTGPGSSDLYNSGSTTALTTTAGPFPGNGETIYATLSSLIDGTWQENQYTFTEYMTPVPAALTAPGTGTTLSDTSATTFIWSTGKAVSAYWLRLGTTGPGTFDLYKSPRMTGLSTTAGPFPANGGMIYARLYSVINGAWQYADYTFVESGTPSPATLIAPTAGSTLSGTDPTTFTWTPGTGVTAYWLYLGTTGPGSWDLYVSPRFTGNQLSDTVGPLPANGATIYATLSSVIDGVWQHEKYTFIESGTPTPAILTSPAGGSTLSNTAPTLFTWTSGTGVTACWLYLGTKGPGASDLYASERFTGSQHSDSVGPLPADGKKVYATLYSVIDGVWHPVHYTFVESAATSAQATQ